MVRRIHSYSRAKKKKLLLIFLITIPILISCTHEAEVSKKNTAAPSPGSPNIQQDSISSDSLDYYFQNPLDFDAYKWKMREMLNCGKKAPALFKPDSAGLYYNYCLFNVMAGKQKSSVMDDNAKLITFHTWKRSLKGKEGDYHAKNEKLLGIQCAMQDDQLEQSDWVGKDSAFIVKKLGQPQKKGVSQFYYYKDHQILIFNFKKNKISWFKYFFLAAPVNENDFTNKRLTHWE